MAGVSLAVGVAGTDAYSSDESTACDLFLPDTDCWPKILSGVTGVDGDVHNQIGGDRLR